MLIIEKLIYHTEYNKFNEIAEVNSVPKSNINPDNPYYFFSPSQGLPWEGIKNYVRQVCITTKYSSNDILNITKVIRSHYTYVEDPPWRNKSNRLLKVEKYNSKYFDLVGEYSYDPDGNFTSLTRSYNSDNFSYDYFSGTNRLKKVTGTTDQYTYDYNGNQTNDYINNNTGIKYDHRNLITEFTRQDLNQDPPITDITRYKYDEAGNRIRKTIYRSNDSNPPPLPEENEDLPSGWSITKDEYYSRDASGKEIAVYQSYNLDYWNVWGAGNEGRIKSTGMKYFFLLPKVFLGKAF